jgi:hypothetical protein
MRVARNLAAFTLGIMGGAALMLSAPLAASDPPPKAQAGHGAHAARTEEGHSAQVDAVPGPEIGFRGCAYFENAGFAGRRADVREGASVEWIGAAWNDRISSVACASGCRLIGYEHINYGGTRRNFSGAVAEAGAGWDDKISALRVVCTQPH